MRKLLFLAAALAAGGCSQPFGAVPVSGTVTMDGKPLANKVVVFQPLRAGKSVNPGPGSSARTDDAGRYVLKVVVDGTDGAVVGEHKVFVLPPDDRPGVLPDRYTGYKGDTELRVTVPDGGTAAADLNLTAK